MKFKFSALPLFFLIYVAFNLITSATSLNCKDTCTADEISAFEEFKKEFYKSYSSAEDECTARGIFCKNYRKINAHNSNPNSTYEMAVTSSTDQPAEKCRATGHIQPTEDEIAKKNTTSAKLLRKAKKVQKSQYSGRTGQSGEVNNGPLTGPVKDQGFCGSCWAFCAAAVLQYQALVYQNRTIEISEQDLIECHDYTGIYGCNGGNALIAISYAFKSGVLPLVKYPYRQTLDTCRRSSNMGQSFPTLADATTANPNGDESVLRKIIDSYGVVATGIGTTVNLTLYRSGVFSDPSCPTRISHCVALVGYGTDVTLGDYWIIKNSWGTDWGESGFFKMKRGVNMCGIETTNYYLPVPK